MKRVKWLVWLLSVAMLCACGANELQQKATPEAPQSEQVDTPVDELSSTPCYTYEDKVVSCQFTDEESGVLYAMYRYSVPMMRVENVDNLTEEAQVIAQRNVESFNAQMQKLLDDAVAFGEETAAAVAEGDFVQIGTTYATDEKELVVTQTGQILTIRADGYYYSGGAHPFVYTDSYTFDLALGQFIDPIQIADDPEQFRTQTAELLVAQAEGLGEEYTAGFWSDYAEIIGHWNDAAVLFDAEGMTVIFSVYELGPYAMGPVELSLPYEELADAIGEGGLAHLGQ